MLKDKTVLITGASRGIGRGIAVKFAENNYFIGINYVKNQQKAEETLELVRNAGGDGVILKADVSDYDQVRVMADKFTGIVKTVDVLVNNAGIYFRNSLDELTADTWDRVIKTNLSGCFYLCKEFVPYMKRDSRIVFISSQLAFKGRANGSDYSASKAGILGLMRSLALELASKGILVNAVAPGTIDTDIIAHYTDEMRKKRIDSVPLKRLGTVEDVANACLFLATDMSSYITGEVINVNGGLYIH